VWPGRQPREQSGDLIAKALVGLGVGFVEPDARLVDHHLGVGDDPHVVVLEHLA